MPVAPHRAIQTSLPAWYRGDVHAVLHFGVIGAAMIASGAALIARQPALLLAVPVLVPVWSVVEYAIHRFVLHAIHPLWPPLSRDHRVHHAYFPATDMFLDTHHDVYRVLLRPHDVVAVEVLVVLICGGIAWIDVGVALAAATAANAYFLLYEVAHAGSHVRSWSDRPLLLVPARHHRAHHAQLDSQRNLANVFPWIDTLFRTSVP